MSKHQISPNKPSTRENSALELTPTEFTGSKEQQLSWSFCPQLVCKINIYPEQIILSQGAQNVAVEINGKSPAALQKLFFMMDGTKSLKELQQQFFPQNPDTIQTIVKDLDKKGLVDDATELRIDSGSDAILALEELAPELLAKNEAQNIFWKQLESTDRELAIKVLFGLVMEYYHFFSYQCYRDSAALSFPSSRAIRQLINERYLRESGQEEILLEALNAIDISREDLTNIIPLPQTTAMCHGLAFWANFEPIFFLTTLEFITEQKLESFRFCLKIGEQLGLESSFLEPIKRLIEIKLNQEPKQLTRRIFQEIPHLDWRTQQRLKGQTYLFREMYDNFYQAIWDYYSSAPNLWRRIEEV